MKKIYQTPIISDQRIAGTAIMLSVSSNVNIKVSTNPRDLWSAR